MKTLFACGAAFVVLWSSVCLAQDPRQRFGRDGSDSQSRLQRFDGFIKMFDVNGDGIIQPSEVPQERKFLFERMAQRAGLDPNSPVSVAQLRDAAIQRYSQGGSSGGRPGGPPGGMMGGPPSSGFSGGGPMGGGPMGGGPMGGAPMSGGPMGGGPMGGGPMSGGPMGGGPMGGFMGGRYMGGGPSGAPGMSAVPGGFGTPGANPYSSYPGGFGQPGMQPGSGQPDASAASASQATGALSQQTAIETQLKCQYYARSLMKQLDANHNGTLEKDEWSKANPSPKAADRNGDGVITLEELTTWVSDCVRKGVAGINPTSYYRALTATERLPDGLPEWFTRKDVDGDGQISMAEFSNHWNDETITEFSRYDLNNDGFVTPAECLEALKSRPQP